MSEQNAPLSLAQAPVAQLSASKEMDVRPGIDRATRPVVLSLLGTGVLWLLISTLLSFVSSVKLQYPSFLNYPILSYGRVTPAADFSLTYGWSSLGLMGIAVWILMRISRRVGLGRGVACVGVAVWNVGLLIGIVSIVMGDMRPYNGLEMPFSSGLLIAAGFALIVLWILSSLRVPELGYSVASLFILGGICWFGWAFLSGNVLMHFVDLRGVSEQIVAYWVVHVVDWLFLTPVALGVSYFLIPKVTGSGLFSGMLGRVSFWLYFATGGLTCLSGLSGGPIPLWLQSVSAASTLLLLIPIGGSVYTLFATMRDSQSVLRSPAANFIGFGLISLLISAVFSSIASFRTVSFAVQFTLYATGVKVLLLQGFVGMVIFGAIYYIMPRLSECEWISSGLIRVHFLCTAYGVCMASSMLIFSGVLSGFDLADPSVAFLQSMQSSAFFYWGRTFSFAIVGVAYISFALHFFLMMLRIGQPEGEATLLRGSHGH